MMLEAVHNGKLHNSVYANIIDRQSDNNNNKPVQYSSQLWWKLNGKDYLNLPKEETFTEINEKRQKFFLDSLEDQVKKIKFMARRPDYMFDYFLITTIDNLPEEIIASIASSMTQIEN